MVDVNEEKTVLVDRDAATDRTSPVGWIVLLVVLVLIALFFMFGGANMFNGSSTGTSGTDNTDVQIETPTNTTPTPSQP